LDRREFLQLAGGVLGAAMWPASALADGEPAGGGALVEYVGRPQNLGTPVQYFDRLITPTDVFFVRSHFGPPALKRERRVRVHGLVERPFELGVADLKDFEPASFTGVLQCAGNGRSLHSPRVPGVQWEHGAMGQGTWTGVRLADLLKKAGVKAGATHVILRGADRPPQPTVPAFVRSLPLEKALDPHTVVASQLNGAPLRLVHGAPMRVIVPGWAGDHWMKWLVELRVADREAEGFYMQTAYKFPRHPVAPGTAVKPSDMVSVTLMPVKSLIGRPLQGARTPAGMQEVVGVAFSGGSTIARVEVSTDGGQSWTAAMLEGEAGPGRWQVFRHRFESRGGACRAMARATDAGGAMQPRTPAWNPSGYFWNAWHEVHWTVSA
jgi:DMSO/TMAO reductase YedYZ molybdopterin-dependent catalytic subunit